MFIAKDSNNNKIHIGNALKGITYFCPVCNAPLIIKEGKINAKHFAHSVGSFCYDSWSHDMSEWHLNWQSKFPIENREVVIKSNTETHRADVLINNTVIEFQHSPINKEEIDSRNKFFTDLDYDVIWVFDAENKVRNWIEDSNEKIDPMKCRSDDLCWKRKNNQYDFKFTNTSYPYIKYNKGKVSVYIQYSIKEETILLQLKALSSKHFEFYPTDDYINEKKFVNIVLGESKSSKTITDNQTNTYRQNKLNTNRIVLTPSYPRIRKRKRNWWL